MAAVMRSARWSALVVLAACCFGCSGTSSGAAVPNSSPTPTASPLANPDSVDRAGVEVILVDVLRGLHSATSISRGASLDTIAGSLQQASQSLGAAAQGLDATPAGVPQTLAVPIAVRLNRLSGLLHSSASCLSRHAREGGTGTRACLPPLRRAEAKDAALAHQLISLAAYGSQSPKLFESRLVQALQGR
jgi:hypothetical protein